MKSFKQYYYLTEDEQLDRELRNKAMKAFRNIHKTLKKAVEEGWVEGLFKKIDSGSHILRNIDKFIDSEYDDLWFIFTPQKKGSGILRKGGLGFNKSGNPVIILDILLDDHNLKYIDTRFAGAKNSFVHEFTHYLDWKRTNVRTGKVRGRASDASIDVVSVEEYVNNPQEFNAYYQEVVSDLQDQAERVLKKIEKEQKKETVEKYANAVFGKSIDEFIQKALNKFPDFVIDNLNDKYMKKLKKRLTHFYDETVKPLIKDYL